MTAQATQPLAPPPTASTERPLLGKVVDQRYHVLQHIGSGGMADVYEVEHVALGRRMAMKVLRPTRTSNPQLARRFAREARAASRIESEHVVAINDYGMLPEGSPYFVMELLRGQNLRSLLTTLQRLPMARAVNIGIDVCLGLHAAHGAGLVHRDLKPENLWLSSGDDGRELCVLLDFGVARFEGAHTTGDGVLVGTARYMSPEQIGSERAPGPASDLFSLGVLLYECLTGVSPFAASSLERTLFRILNEPPQPLGELVDDIPGELLQVIERALAKEPAARFASALDLAAALLPFAGVQRLLPSLDAASGRSLSDETLAEPEPAVSTTPYAEPTPAPAHSVTSTGRTVLFSFAAGLALGAASLFLVWRPRETPAPAVVPPAGTTPALALPPASDAPRATPSLPTSTATSISAARTAAVSPVARSRPQPVAAPSVSKPTRPEPPRPNFDGRNPYLQ
jgi:serine/threonine-protein kinase